MSANAVDALAAELEASGLEIESVDEDGMVVLFIVDEGFGPEEDTWVALPAEYGLTVWLSWRDDPDTPWLVVLETPPMTDLGDLAEVGRVIEQTEVLEWDIEATGGSAALLIGVEQDIGPGEGPDVVYEAVSWFLHILDGFAWTGLDFAPVEVHDEATTPGYDQLDRGVTAGETSDYESGARLFEEASQVFGAAGLRLQRVVADIALTAARFMSGGLASEAREALEALEGELVELGEDELRGQTIEYRAMLHQIVGDHRAASSIYASAPGSGPSSAPDMMRVMAGLGDPRTSSWLRVGGRDLRRRREHLPDPQAAAERDAAESIAALRHGDLDRAADLLVSAADAFEQLGDNDSRFAAVAQLATAYYVAGRKAEAAELLEVLTQIEISDHYRRNPYNNFIVLKLLMDWLSVDSSNFEAPTSTTEGLRGELIKLVEQVSLTKTASYEVQIDLLERCRNLIDETDDPMARAEVTAELARQRIHQSIKRARPDFFQEAKRGLGELVEAIVLHDEVRYRLTNVQDRSHYTTKMLSAYELAVLTAMDLVEDDELVAELLQRVQALGVPDHVELSQPASAWLGTAPWAATAPRAPESSDAVDEGERRAYDLIASLGVLPVASPPHTSVGGRSALAGESSTVVALEDRIVGQAGAGAWWWSMWLASETLYWATRSPSGDHRSGMVALDPEGVKAGVARNAGSLVASLIGHHFDHGPLGEHLDRLRADVFGGERSGQRPRAQRTDPMRGLLGADAREELELMLRIGELVVPEPLQDALRNASRRDPLRILVSPAPSLGWLPLCLLATCDRSGRPVRLLERAVIQVMSPLNSLDQRPRDLSDSTGMGRPRTILSIVDPIDDLGAIRSLGGISSRLLAGRDWAAESSRRADGLADRATVLEELRRADRFAALLYAGHGHRPGDGDPLSAGLTLTAPVDAPDCLTVGDLLVSGPELRLPPVTILCACSTATDHQAAGVERWGLPSALLLAGCRSVVATTWDLVSCPATAAIAGRLALSLSSADDGLDAPAVLRGLQLELLDDWRGDVAAGRTDFVQESLGNHHPYLWAAFVAMVAEDAGSAPAR